MSEQESEVPAASAEPTTLPAPPPAPVPTRPDDPGPAETSAHFRGAEPTPDTAVTLVEGGSESD